MLGLAIGALPQKLVAEAVGLVLEIALVAGVTFHYVHKYDQAHEAATVAAIRASQQAAIDAANAKAASAAADLETERSKSHVVYQTITHEVDHVTERPVYRSECLDADGVRLVNAALSGSSAASGVLDPALPTDPTSDGQHGR